jgi:hypothetical protein
VYFFSLLIHCALQLVPECCPPAISLQTTVNGTITEPKSGEEQVTYMEKSAQAAGAMFLAVEASQHVHFNGIKMDGPAIWAKLQSTHLQKVSGACYNALDAVFNVRKQSDKSLPSLASSVDTLV